MTVYNGFEIACWLGANLQEAPRFSSINLIFLSNQFTTAFSITRSFGEAYIVLVLN